jgi:hypothetical protein
VLLGVIQARQGAPVCQREPLEVEQHGGRDERPCERATTGLVGAGDEAPLEGAIEGEEAAAAARGVRACRRGSAAST